MATADETRLANLKAAETAILDGGQEFTSAGVTYRRADLNTIQAAIARLEQKVGAASTTTKRRHAGNPRRRC